MLDDITTRHHQKDDLKKDFYKLRNILNIIFMVSAVIGVVIYIYVAHIIGVIIILVAMAFKLVECCLRIIH